MRRSLVKVAHGKTCKYAARSRFTQTEVCLQWQNESVPQRSQQIDRLVLRVIALFKSWIIWILSCLVSRVSNYLWAVLYAPKEHLHLDDTTIPTPAISYIATCSEVACCTIDQVTAIPMGLLHLGYLASHSSSFEQPRASQGVMLVETPSPHWKPPPATQDGTVGCASYYPGLAPASPTISEVATHIPSRVPSWVKSSWRHPTDKAQSSRGPKPCPSAPVHCTFTAPGSVYQVHPSSPSSSETCCTEGTTPKQVWQGVPLQLHPRWMWEPTCIPLQMYTGKASIQGPSRLCTVETGPPDHKCYPICMQPGHPT